MNFALATAFALASQTPLGYPTSEVDLGSRHWMIGVPMSAQGSFCSTGNCATYRRIFSESTELTSSLQSTSPQKDATSAPISGHPASWFTVSCATNRRILSESTTFPELLQSTLPCTRPLGVADGPGVGVVVTSGVGVGVGVSVISCVSSIVSVATAPPTKVRASFQI